MSRRGNTAARASAACGPISRTSPAAFSIGGLARGETTGLMFPPDYPLGIETDTAGAWADDVGRPLVTLAEMGVEVGNDCPGELVLVRGHVQVRDVPLVTAGDYQSFGPDRNQWSMAPYVKLAISSHGNPGWTVIDCDSEVVMPGGTMTLRVVAPWDWFLLPPWPDGIGDLGAEQLALRISACPCDCGYSPEGVLTWWQPFDGAEPVPVAERVHARPRRGWGLEVSALGDPTLSCYASNDPGATTQLSRVAVAPGALVRWERWGAPFLYVDANQPTVAHGRWGIK